MFQASRKASPDRPVEEIAERSSRFQVTRVGVHPASPKASQDRGVDWVGLPVLRSSKSEVPAKPGFNPSQKDLDICL